MEIKVELKCEDGYRRLVAVKRFHQGEEVVAIPQNTQPYPDQYSIEVYPGVHANCNGSLVSAINHSCEPNAAVRNGRIVAWTCINPGDEIRIDYKRTETRLDVPFDCNCGSLNCRGRIE